MSDLLKLVITLAVCTAVVVSVFFTTSCVEQSNRNYCGDGGGTWIDGSSDTIHCVKTVIR
jgi:hypothetical protein